MNIQNKLTSRLQSGFSFLPTFDEQKITARAEDILLEIADQMADNFPYHHPLYAGQMLKPPHPIAAAAYAMAMQLNPNNHALDGGRASSQMEKDAVAHIAQMFGFGQHLGHLSSNGTIANLEALWVAGRIHPDKIIVASEMAHYTHQRISAVLQLPFEIVASDFLGRIDISALEQKLKTGNVGTVVATLGTTGAGAVDDLESIVALQKKYDFRIHVDAAYGGYFTLSDQVNSRVKRQFQSINQADSVVLDPHKHGLQPYGCGCVIFANPAVGQYYKHDSPYTYFSSKDLHLGEISLECSRAGASAVALYATQQLLPCTPGGDFASMLNTCIETARWLYHQIENSIHMVPLFKPELDIVLWSLKGESAADISRKNVLFFENCAKKNLHLALYQVRTDKLPPTLASIVKNENHVTVLRSCLMKPEHWDWKERIFDIMKTCEF